MKRYGIEVDTPDMDLPAVVRTLSDLGWHVRGIAIQRIALDEALQTQARETCRPPDKETKAPESEAGETGGGNTGTQSSDGTSLGQGDMGFVYNDGGPGLGTVDPPRDPSRIPEGKPPERKNRPAKGKDRFFWSDKWGLIRVDAGVEVPEEHVDYETTREAALRWGVSRHVMHPDHVDKILAAEEKAEREKDNPPEDTRTAPESPAAALAGEDEEPQDPPETEAGETGDDEKPATVEDVRAALLQLNEAKGMDKCVSLLGELGVKQVSALDEGQYSEALAKINAELEG